MCRLASLLFTLALAASGCGDDVATTTADPPSTTAATTTSLATTTLPTTTADDEPQDRIATAADDDPLVSCPSGAAFPLSAIDSVRPASDAPAGVDEAMRSFLDTEEGVFWPQNDWRILDETAERILLVHVGDRSTAAETGIDFMSIEAVDGEWQWSGASGRADCPLQFQLDEGLGIVEWELDPAHPSPEPAHSVVHILATERACASAQPMGDRLHDAIVLADASQVSITLSVEPLTGGQECPGNPAAEVEVELGEPLGERRLVDGRAVGIDLEDLLAPS